MAAKSRSGRSGRLRIGAVTLYVHHGAWWISYREGSERFRRRVGTAEAEAVAVASAVNAQMAAGQQSMFAFQPVDFDIMLDRWLSYHEHVLQSSVQTVDRYRTATDHARRYHGQFEVGRKAHAFDATGFVSYLRKLHVTPNGHPHTPRRPLTGRGIAYILATCRSAFHYAARNRMLPPYAENPFAALPIKRMANASHRRPIHVFTEDEEYQFLATCDRWQFAIFYTLSRTGLRPAELTHLLTEDIDPSTGLLHIRSKSDLGWEVKTRRSRAVPLPEETIQVLQKVGEDRRHGPLFLRRQFQNSSGPVSTDSEPAELARGLERRVQKAAIEGQKTPSRHLRQKLARGLWRDLGALTCEHIRREFGRLTKAIGLPEVTAPKCWRHTYATLMLEAEVDPLVRQLTLGHKPADDAKAALGMTSVYSHVRPEIHRRQLQRVIDLRPLVSTLVHRFLEEQTD